MENNKHAGPNKHAGWIKWDLANPPILAWTSLYIRLFESVKSVSSISGRIFGSAIIRTVLTIITFLKRLTFTCTIVRDPSKSLKF